MPDKPEIFEHKAASSFWQAYSSLSADVQALADKNFSLLKSDSRHPSLQFKKVGKLWSARVGRDHRALAVAIPAGFLWVWIGKHEEYDKLI
ncbi:MAG: hypothetical protein JNM99_18270 [Verrucomicrobiaceae bacterium]|nr:hypothetical protein [Verrucomicrobiaceae bacterium]